MSGSSYSHPMYDPSLTGPLTTDEVAFVRAAPASSVAIAYLKSRRNLTDQQARELYQRASAS